MTKISEISHGSSEDNSDIEKRLHDNCKHLLKGSLFIGTFKEKRFVDSLNAYRDVIKIDDDEEDLIETLLIVKKRCCKFYGDKQWIGVTTPTTIGAPAGYNIWVTLDEEVFGMFWYKIRGVYFYDNEICLKLKTIRPYEKQKVENIDGNTEATMSPEEILENSRKICSDSFQSFLLKMKELLTFNNIKEATIFLFVLLATILTFLIHTIQFLMEYLLKLIQELRKLITSCTPIVQTFMKCTTQFCTGILATIAFLLKGNQRTTVTTIAPSNFYPQNQHDQFVRARALPSSQPYYQNRYFPTYPQSSVRITPLN